MLPPKELTEEHIVPLALSGTLRFKNATCEPCRKISNERYENPALQADFLAPRILLELKRRHKKTGKRLPVCAFGDSTRSSLETFQLALTKDEYPKRFDWIVLPPPGRLVGVSRGGEIQELRIQSIAVGIATGREPESATTRTLHDHTAFGLTIAKIAYCFAVAELGLERIDLSDLRALLLGQRSDLYNFVGSWQDARRLRLGFLHWLSISRIGGLYVARVHQFASFGCIPRQVVLGPAVSSPASEK